jgi:hypothetical protein
MKPCSLAEIYRCFREVAASIFTVQPNHVGHGSCTYGDEETRWVNLVDTLV